MAKLDVQREQDERLNALLDTYPMPRWAVFYNPTRKYPLYTERIRYWSDMRKELVARGPVSLNQRIGLVAFILKGGWHCGSELYPAEAIYGFCGYSDFEAPNIVYFKKQVAELKKASKVKNENAAIGITKRNGV